MATKLEAWHVKHSTANMQNRSQMMILTYQIWPNKTKSNFFSAYQHKVARTRKQGETDIVDTAVNEEYMDLLSPSLGEIFPPGHVGSCCAGAQSSDTADIGVTGC